MYNITKCSKCNLLFYIKRIATYYTHTNWGYFKKDEYMHWQVYLTCNFLIYVTTAHVGKLVPGFPNDLLLGGSRTYLAKKKFPYLCSCKLMLVAAVHAIWQERNSRIFKARARNECAINSITLYVRARLSTLQGFKPSQENRWLLSSWGLSHDIFVSPV